MIYVANPLYDAVFKYLMEDDRIAKTILSALLKKKVVRVDERQFEGDTDMEYIVRRLLSAASDPDMRYQMNVEDEYFQELESRDTQLMEKDKQLEEKNAQLEEKNTMIRAMIQGMTESGKSIEAIAKMVNRTVDEVRAMIGR